MASHRSQANAVFSTGTHCMCRHVLHRTFVPRTTVSDSLIQQRVRPRTQDHYRLARSLQIGKRDRVRQPGICGPSVRRRVIRSTNCTTPEVPALTRPGLLATTTGRGIRRRRFCQAPNKRRHGSANTAALGELGSQPPAVAVIVNRPAYSEFKQVVNYSFSGGASHTTPEDPMDTSKPKPRRKRVCAREGC